MGQTITHLIRIKPVPLTFRATYVDEGLRQVHKTLGVAP
jgi:hypothetical protein